jgi:hypothetical protein
MSKKNPYLTLFDRGYMNGFEKILNNPYHLPFGSPEIRLTGCI